MKAVRDSKGRFVDCSMENNTNWHGGKRKHSQGYIEIKVLDHPYTNNSGYVLEHRLVMEKHLGRYLEQNEVVHHINGIKIDNRIENLELIKNQSEHRHFHKKDMSNRICIKCDKKETWRREWYRHPITKEEWLCYGCYQSERRRLRLKRV
jgi:HNH endonuclease